MLTGCNAEDISYIPAPEAMSCGYQIPGDTVTTDTINLNFRPLENEQATMLRHIAHNAVSNYYEYGTRSLEKNAMDLACE